MKPPTGNYSPRSTRSQRGTLKAHQAEVVAYLAQTSHNVIAQRLKRCQHDRQHRQAGRYPWRCGSAGCWACRRNTIRKWLQALEDWQASPTTTLVVIPISGNLIASTGLLRKGVRDVRDRAARRDRRWQKVSFGGLAEKDRALILIKHVGIGRPEVRSILLRRWPKVTLHNVGDVEPNSWLSAADAADLARRRRGVEGLRIVVMPQRASLGDGTEAMPFTFCDP